MDDQKLDRIGEDALIFVPTAPRPIGVVVLGELRNDLCPGVVVRSAGQIT